MLITVLLMLMPLQSAWATAAAYCDHESGTHQRHFGHHDGHHHEAAVGNAGDVGYAGAAGWDSDASHCHGSVSALLTVPLSFPTQAAAQPSASCADAHRPAPALSPPERPQWIGHA